MKQEITSIESDIFRNYTSNEDRLRVSKFSNVGITTVNNLIYRKTYVTEKNYNAYLQLLRISKMNAEFEKGKAATAVKTLNQIINKIEK